MQHQQYTGMFSKPPDQVNHSRQMQHGGNVPGGGGISRNQYIHHPPQGPIYQHQQVCYPSGMYSTRRAAPVRVSLLRDIGIAGERDKDYSTIPQSALTGFGGKMPPAFIAQSKGFNIPASNQLHDRNQLMFNKISHGGFSQMPQSSIKLDTRALTSPNTATSPQLTGLHLVHGGIKKEQPLLVHQEVPPGKYPPTNPHYHHHHHHHTSLSESSPASQGNIGSAPDNNSAIKTEDAPEEQSAGANDSKIKEELLRVMLQVDNQITEVQKELKSLDEKKATLEAKKNKAEEAPEKPSKEIEEDASRSNIEPKHRDLWQVIYAENRKKSEKAMSLLDGFGSCYDIPLYNQPCDTQVYHDNIKKNQEMRPKLIKFFQQKKRLQKIRAQYTAARYEELQNEWQQKVEQIENNPKQKAKDAKARELFEKVFPDIRKQRIQQERTDRAGTRGDACRSDADFAEIVDGLSEQENQLTQMRHLAVVPPRLLDIAERKVQFINNNGLIRDPFKVFKESMRLDSWTEKEKKIFMEKYVQHPKNFHVISSFIEKKGVSDSILYYYLTKKTNHYKQLVRKHSLKPKKPKPGRNNQVAVTAQQQEQTPVKDVAIKSDKVEMEKEKKHEVEERRIDRPPSPRMTRARMQTLNWKEDEISIVKEGFAKHGKDFLAVSRMLSDKTEQQVRNYFNNYKKKHGFEQLVENNKKKKGYESRRQTRRGQSPDTPTSSTATSNATSTTTASTTGSNTGGDTAVSTADDAKGSSKKDKNNEDSNKKGGENQSSSSSSGNKGSDNNDTSVKVNLTSTSQMRTRRKTAAIAAAAVSSLAAQDAEVTTGYKRSSSRPASGEPSDKRSKKNEAKKSKHSKASNAAEKDTSQNTEEKKSTRGDHKKHDSNTSVEKREDVPKRAASKVKSEVVTASSGGEEKVNKSVAQTIKTSTSNTIATSGDQKTTTTAANSRASAADTTDKRTTTCEQNQLKTFEEKGVVQRSSTDSPYAFDDDANDATTRIRLEPLREHHPSSSATKLPSSSVSSSVVVSTASTPTKISTSSNASKMDSGTAEVVPSTSTDTTVPTSDKSKVETPSSAVAAASKSDSNRPHSLPPQSSTTASPVVVVSSTSITNLNFRAQAMPSPTADSNGSRPSSTPSAGDIFNKEQQHAVVHQRAFVVVTTTAAGQTNFTKLSSAIDQTQPTIVDLTYDDEANQAKENMTYPNRMRQITTDVLPSSTGHHAKTSTSEKDQTKPRTPIPTAIPVNSLRFTTTRESPIPTLQKSYASPVMSTKPLTSSAQGVAINLQTTHHPTSSASQQRHQQSPAPVIEITPFALDPATATAFHFAKHSGGMTSPRPPAPHQIASMTYGGPVLTSRPVDGKKFRSPGDDRGGHPPPPSSHRQSPKPQQHHAHLHHRFPAPQPSVSLADFGRPGSMSSSSNGAKAPDDVTVFPGGVPVKIEKPSPEHQSVVSFRSPPPNATSSSVNLKTEKPPTGGGSGVPQMTSDYPPRGSIMSGTPIRRKMSEDATASPPRLIQHSRQASATPPSMNQQQQQQQGRFAKQRKDQSSRTASPLSYHSDHGFHQAKSSQAAQMSSFVPPGLDRALKEEIKRPSSVTSSEKRHSNDRSSPMSSARANLSHTSKSPHPDSSHAHSEASSLAGGNIPLLFAPPRMGPRFPRAGKLDGSGLALWHEYSQSPHQTYPQALMPQFQRSVRPFPTSPNMNDPLDGSRHNVLTQDFATAQLMQKHALAARNFRQGSMFNPILSPMVNQSLGVRPPMSSAASTAISVFDRMNYMQQSSMAVSTMASIRASSSIPVSSAHLLISQSTAAAMINNRPRFSSPQAYHPRLDNPLYSTRKSASSPHHHHHAVTSQALQHHHNTIMISSLTPSGVSAAAEMMSRPGVSEASMSAANASLLAAAVKQQQQQSYTPRVGYYQPPPTITSDSMKADVDSALRAASEQQQQQQRIVTSPMIRSPFLIASAAEIQQQQQQRKEQSSSSVANRGMSPVVAGGSVSNISSLQQQRPPSREMAVASRDEQNQLMNASAAKDLKAKGKTTLTPQGFISAIIDHNIRRYGESMEEKTQKPILPLEDFSHYPYVEDVKSRPHSVEHRPQDLAKQQQQHEGVKSSSPIVGGRSSVGGGDKVQGSTPPIKVVTLHQPFLPGNVSTPSSSRISPAPACLSTMQDRTNSIIASIYRPELKAQAAAAVNAANREQASDDMRTQHRPQVEVSESYAAVDHRNRMRATQGKFGNQVVPTGPSHPLMNHPTATSIHNSSSLDLIIRTALMGDPASRAGLASQGGTVVIPPPFSIDDQFIKGHLSRASPNPPPHSSANDNNQQQQQTRQTALSVSTSSRHNSRSSDTPSPSSVKFKHGSDTSSHYGSNPNISGFENLKTSAPSTAPVQLFSALRFRTPEQSSIAAQPGGSTTSIGSRSSGSVANVSQQPQQSASGVARIVAGNASPAGTTYQQRTAQRPPPTNNSQSNNNELNYEPISDDED